MKNMEILKKQDYLLEDLDMSTRLYQFLKNSLKIKSLGELSKKTESEISSICGTEGQSYLKEIKNILNDKKIFFKEESGDKIQEPNIELIEFEKDMIRATLLLNPENLDLSPNELDKRVNKEYLDSRD